MSQHLPTVNVQCDVFSSGVVTSARDLGIESNDPVAIAHAAWSDIKDWVTSGYQPVVEVITVDGSYDVDLETGVVL